jgi:hypothetical protein
MLKKIIILFCFACLLLSKAQSEPASAFGDSVTQGVQKSNGRDSDKKDGKDDDEGDDDDDSGGGDNSGSSSDNDSDNSDDNSGSGNDDGGNGDDSDDDDNDNSGSGGDHDSDDGDSESDDDDSGDSGNGGDNGNSGSGNDNDDNDNDDNDNDDNSGNSGNNGNGGNGHSDDSNDDSNDDNSGKGKDGDDSEQDNSGKDEDDYERRYYVGAVSASDGKSVLMGGTRLESTSPWLEVLSTGVWFEAYGYWQGNSFVAEDINILDNEAWSYFRGPASVVGVRAKGNVEVWTKTSGVDTRLTSNEQVRLVAYFDGSQYRSLPVGLTPPTMNVPTGWVEITGTFDGQNIIWSEARTFP